MIRYPRIIWNHEKLWLKVQVDGEDRECEVSFSLAIELLIDLARALRVLR